MSDSYYVEENNARSDRLLLAQVCSLPIAYLDGVYAGEMGGLVFALSIFTFWVTSVVPGDVVGRRAVQDIVNCDAFLMLRELTSKLQGTQAGAWKHVGGQSGTAKVSEMLASLGLVAGGEPLGAGEATTNIRETTRAWCKEFKAKNVAYSSRIALQKAIVDYDRPVSGPSPPEGVVSRRKTRSVYILAMAIIWGIDRIFCNAVLGLKVEPIDYREAIKSLA